MCKKLRAAVWATCLLYCAFMAWLLFMRTPGGISEINLVPFKTIKEFWTVILQSWGIEGTEVLLISSVINLVGNVVMFIPLGLFPPLLWGRFRKGCLTMLLCAAVIVAVETLQYVLTVGSADIDDFILNMIGAAMGYAAFTLSKRLPEREKHFSKQ